MANGASRLFNIIKNTSESTNLNPSQVVSLTVKSTSPIIFKKDDKLDITEEFCIFDRTFNKSTMQIGDIVIAFVFNDGQIYFIQQNESSDYVGNYNLLDNLPKINGVVLKGNRLNYQLGINDYLAEETAIGKFKDGRIIYRKWVEGTTNNNTQALVLAENISLLINDKIYIKREGFDQYHSTSPTMDAYDSAHASPVFLDTDSNEIKLYIRTSVYLNQPFYGYLEYIKKQDF